MSRHRGPGLCAVEHGWSLEGHYYVTVRTGAERGPFPVRLVCLDKVQAKAIAEALDGTAELAAREEERAEKAKLHEEWLAMNRNCVALAEKSARSDAYAKSADVLLGLLQDREDGIGNVDANEVARAFERLKYLSRVNQ